MPLEQGACGYDVGANCRMRRPPQRSMLDRHHRHIAQPDARRWNEASVNGLSAGCWTGQTDWVQPPTSAADNRSKARPVRRTSGLESWKSCASPSRFDNWSKRLRSDLVIAPWSGARRLALDDVITTPLSTRAISDLLPRHGQASLWMPPSPKPSECVPLKLPGT